MTIAAGGVLSADNPPTPNISRAANLLISPAFKKIQRHQPALGSRRPRLPLVPSQGGSLGRRSEAAAGADGAGSRCANRGAGPGPVASGGSAGRGGGPGGIPRPFEDCLVGQPARRRRCGKARTRPPDASFRKTSRAERLSFAETVFSTLIRAKARALRHASRSTARKRAAPSLAQTSPDKAKPPRCYRPFKRLSSGHEYALDAR